MEVKKDQNKNFISWSISLMSWELKKRNINELR